MCGNGNERERAKIITVAHGRAKSQNPNRTRTWPAPPPPPSCPGEPPHAAPSRPTRPWWPRFRRLPAGKFGRGQGLQGLWCLCMCVCFVVGGGVFLFIYFGCMPVCVSVSVSVSVRPLSACVRIYICINTIYIQYPPVKSVCAYIIYIHTRTHAHFLPTCQNVLHHGGAQLARLDLQRLVLEGLLGHLGGVLGEEGAIFAWVDVLLG